MDRDCDVFIAGGGTGGVAAALAACSAGRSVVLTEESPWLGGQLTSQCVPPDEHPWIESFGCTAAYRRFRNLVRQIAGPGNPGGGWVSGLCFEPAIGAAVLEHMIAPYVASGRLEVRHGSAVRSAEMDGERVRSLKVVSRQSEESIIFARFVLDATELGDLLPLTNTPYQIGQEESDEPSAGPADPLNQQALTWCFAMAHDPGSHRTIDKPDSYARWRSFQPPFWPGPLIGEVDIAPKTGLPRTLPFVGEGSWFSYRQIVPAAPGRHAVTIVNWPMNDYFLGPVVEQNEADVLARLADSKELGRCLLYWLQSEMGLTGLYLRPDVACTSDGFAMTPYFRESRRIEAVTEIKERDVSLAANPGLAKAIALGPSVGIGAYRIDLHPTTGGDNYLDIGSLPFEIPIGCLIPRTRRNLLAACKNIGTSHITNGCYRLHPVEWNIGESAGYLAAHCLDRGVEPQQVAENPEDFQSELIARGVELHWPDEVYPL